MAELFLATAQNAPETPIVIKRVRASAKHDPSFVAMLLAEARIASSLRHSNIVRILDAGEADGQAFLAMEHVDGEDLRAIVRQLAKTPAPAFPLEHVVAIVLGLCAALAHASERGVVHRDVSPPNVMVTFTGEVKLVDFGLATASGVCGGAQVALGERASAKGKVAYMSPEQARGEPVDGRSDVFALGILLFELTTAKRLFKGLTEYETLRLISDRDAPRPSEIRPGYPLDLERIVMKALARSVADRTSDAGSMGTELASFARRHGLPTSNDALSRFMRTLFSK
jgi:serine/threonine-protein kinase